MFVGKWKNTSDLIKSDKQLIYDLRKAAECHKYVRKNVQSIIKPGVKILDICEKIEGDVVKYFGNNNNQAGVAFPTGVSLNYIVAHDTANIGDERVVGHDDICKIDFGTHVNGMIIDSAFSACFNPEYEELLNASHESVWEAIKMMRPDTYLYDVSGRIQEIIESYEVTIGGKTYPVHAVADLGGHNIKPYNIHAGKLILCAPYNDQEYKAQRVEADEQYAIETFASTGLGKMMKSSTKPSNHYMMTDTNRKSNSKLKTVKNIEQWIRKNRGTLAFCPRWLQNEFKMGVPMTLNYLARKCDPPVVTEYNVLEDSDKNALVSQYEHTIYVSENVTEVLSLGDDY